MLVSEGKSRVPRYMAWFDGQVKGVQILVTLIALVTLGAACFAIASLFGVDLSPLHTK